MTMKTRFLPLLLAAVLPLGSNALADLKFELDLGKADTKDGVLTIPFDGLDNRLTGQDRFIKVVDGEGIKGKMVTFEGKEAGPLSSAKKISCGEEIHVSIDVKPEDDGDTSTWQSVFYLYIQCELRYHAGNKTMRWIVWHSGDTKKYSEIAVPMKPGKWSRVEASVVGRKMELRVEGEKAEAELPEEVTKRFAETQMIMGYGSNRPFTGSFANLVVSDKKLRK